MPFSPSRRTTRRLALSAATAAAVLSFAAPASADCVAVRVTYTPPGGSTTAVGSSCVASTPFPTTLTKDFEAGTTRTGVVTVQYSIPLP